MKLIWTSSLQLRENNLLLLLVTKLVGNWLAQSQEADTANSWVSHYHFVSWFLSSAGPEQKAL
jgi:hypothetical protein